MKLTARSIVAFMTALGLCSVRVQAGDAEAVPDTNWQISTLIHGNTEQVREAINGPLEEQLNRKAEKVKRSDELKHEIADKAAVVSAQLAKSTPEFSSAQADLAAAKSALTIARDHNDGPGAIEAQNRITADQALISQKVIAASAGDPQMATDQAELDELSAGIRHMGPVIEKAAKAREILVNGLRIPVRLPGPSTGSGTGVLGSIKPIKIIDAHSFTADYDLVVITGEDKHAKGPDGMKTLTGTKERVHLLVEGFDDTSTLKEHDDVTIDQYYQLAGPKKIGRVTFIVARRAQPDQKIQLMERLFQVLDDLHVPAGEKAESYPA
jgi:hypothetical protein